MQDTDVVPEPNDAQNATEGQNITEGQNTTESDPIWKRFPTFYADMLYEEGYMETDAEGNEVTAEWYK